MRCFAVPAGACAARHAHCALTSPFAPVISPREYQIIVDAPGFYVEDINVRVDDGVLSMWGEKKAVSGTRPAGVGGTGRGCAGA